jgi:phytoene synthase
MSAAVAFDVYCRKAVPPGSILHYSLLGQPIAQRQRLLAVYALQRELREIVEAAARDSGVAQAKLGWWREELQRLHDDGVRHPLTQALSDWLAQDTAVQDTVRAAIDDWFDAIEHDLQHGVYLEFAQLQEYCRHSGRPAVLLLARAVDGQQGDFIADYSIAWMLYERLLAVRSDALRGRLYLPEDELAQHGLRFEDLQRNQDTPALRALFALQAGRIRDYFAQAETRLTPGERYRQRHLIILSRLCLAQLAAIESEAYRLLEQQLTLPPLRLLWIAYRTLRQLRSYRNLPNAEE